MLSINGNFQGVPYVSMQKKFEHAFKPMIHDLDVKHRDKLLKGLPAIAVGLLELAPPSPSLSYLDYSLCFSSFFSQSFLQANFASFIKDQFDLYFLNPSIKKDKLIENRFSLFQACCHDFKECQMVLEFELDETLFHQCFQFSLNFKNSRYTDDTMNCLIQDYFESIHIQLFQARVNKVSDCETLTNKTLEGDLVKKNQQISHLDKRNKKLQQALTELEFSSAQRLDEYKISKKKLLKSNQELKTKLAEQKQKLSDSNFSFAQRLSVLETEQKELLALNSSLKLDFTGKEKQLMLCLQELENLKCLDASNTDQLNKLKCELQVLKSDASCENADQKDKKQMKDLKQSFEKQRFKNNELCVLLEKVRSENDSLKRKMNAAYYQLRQTSDFMDRIDQMFEKQLLKYFFKTWKNVVLNNLKLIRPWKLFCEEYKLSSFLSKMPKNLSKDHKFFIKCELNFSYYALNFLFSITPRFFISNNNLMEYIVYSFLFSNFLKLEQEVSGLNLKSRIFLFDDCKNFSLKLQKNFIETQEVKRPLKKSAKVIAEFKHNYDFPLDFFEDVKFKNYFVKLYILFTLMCFFFLYLDKKDPFFSNFF